MLCSTRLVTRHSSAREACSSSSRGAGHSTRAGSMRRLRWWTSLILQFGLLGSSERTMLRSQGGPTSPLVCSLLQVWPSTHCLGHHRASYSRAGCLGDVAMCWNLQLPGCAAKQEHESQWMHGIEVIAEGLPAFHGAQLAIDTTLVSPLRADGEPHRRCSDVDGAASKRAHLPRGLWRPSKLIVLAGETGGRFSEETQTFIRRGLSLTPGNRGPTGRVPSWLAPLLGHSRRLCSTVVANRGRMATSLALTSARSSSELNRCRPHECQDRRDVCSFF